MGEQQASVVRVDLTGDLRVAVGDTVVASSAFPGRQGRLTFAYLAAHRRPVPRDELAEALWPGGPPANWRRDLSWLISRLRRGLTSAGLDGAAALPGGGGCYQLRLPAGAEVDVELAASRTEAAARKLRDGDTDAALADALAGVEIARRPFLPGEDAEWIEASRQALDASRLAALDVAATVLGDRGDISSARALAGEAVDLAPFRESGYTRLIRLHLAAGDRAEALRTYHRCRELLAQELGVDPGPETQAAYVDALRVGVRTMLGEASYLTGSDRIDDVQPYEESLGNLPTAADRFVGRERDLEMVATAPSSSRLVTLTGVGGVGKSRLGLEAATRLAPVFPDGAWQCELSSVDAGRDVAHALATTLGVVQQGGLSAEESVLIYLRGRQLLLILDNCEHVLDSVAVLLAALLRRCPHVSVVATSRERLAVSGEQVVAVEPLAVPVPGTDVLAGPVRPAAVELFCIRAGAARVGFELTTANVAAVAEICRRLDGVPLALELAAARVATLGVRDIVTRLNERFWLLRGGSRGGHTRSQTLGATVDWSYDLLTQPQRRVFHRLSVFAGRFALKGAQAVCADDHLQATEVAEAVLALADKSMLVAQTAGEHTRFRLLETLREYGRDKLDESGDAATTSLRHAAYFVEEAETAAQGLLGPDEASSVASLHGAFDDLRSAHRWCLEHGQADLDVRLVSALHWYAHWRSRSEVFVWANETLAAVSSQPGLSAVYATAAGGAWRRGDRNRAAELSRLGVAAAGAGTARRFPLHILGDVAMIEGRLSEAADLYEEASSAARETGDEYHVALMVGNVAFACGYNGEQERAAQAISAARDIARSCGNPTAQAWATYVSAELRLEDDPIRAMELFDTCLTLARTVDNRFLLGVALVSASSLRGRHGEPREAIRMFLDVIRLWQSAGNWAQQWVTLRNVIELFVRLGVNLPAAVLLGAVQAAATAAPPFGPDAERLVHARRTLTSRLGARHFATAAADGEEMPPEAVVEFASVQLRRALAASTEKFRRPNAVHPHRATSDKS